MGKGKAGKNGASGPGEKQEIAKRLSEESRGLAGVEAKLLPPHGRGSTAW